MKKIICLACACAALLTAYCGKDYRPYLVGKWDAGKAALGSEMIVTVKGDGTLTAEITNKDIQPVTAKYTIVGDEFTIMFPKLPLSYKIVYLDKERLVMKSKYARITWMRLK
jgi:hypothetical protein